LLTDLATEDHGDLVRLPDGSIGIEQALAQVIQCRTATEDEIVAVVDLRAALGEALEEMKLLDERDQIRERAEGDVRGQAELDAVA